MAWGLSRLEGAKVSPYFLFSLRFLELAMKQWLNSVVVITFFFSCFNGIPAKDVPDINFDELPSLSKYNADGEKKYFESLVFTEDDSFLVGGKGFVYKSVPLNGVGTFSNFQAQSDQLPFTLEDDPLFLCQHSDSRSRYCGSHVKSLIPLSDLGFDGSTNFYSVQHDILLCSTSSSRTGSSLFLMNGTTLSNIRKIDFEAEVSDDPFATPHELYHKARIICPEIPDEHFAYEVLEHNGKKLIMVGLWVRRIGIQLKVLSNIQLRNQKFLSDIASTLFNQPPLNTVGEVIGFHNDNSKYLSYSFIRQDDHSSVIRVFLDRYINVPSGLDVPFEKTFSQVLSSSIVCLSKIVPSECLRHGFCFTNTFQYFILKDLKTIDDHFLLLFTTPASSLGQRSALCHIEISKVTASFNNCEGVDSTAGSQCNIIKSHSLHEYDGAFTSLQVDSTEHALRTFISTGDGKILKGAILKGDANSWTYFSIASLQTSEKNAFSSIHWHAKTESLVGLSDSSVYVVKPREMCPIYTRIRHCIGDYDCSWNYDTRQCEKSKDSFLNNLIESKKCSDKSVESVSINASQGSTVRLVCNPPCTFSGKVVWNIDLDDNKYLMADDVLVLFDLFGVRRRARGQSSSPVNIDSLKVSCSNAEGSLVNFVINKTCGAYCQRSRNMENWCLKTWRHKMGISQD